MKVFVMNSNLAPSLLGCAALCRAFAEEGCALSVTDEVCLIDSLAELEQLSKGNELQLYFPYFRIDGKSKRWLNQALTGEPYKTVLIADIGARDISLLTSMQQLAVRNADALMLASSADALIKGRIEDQYAATARRIIESREVTADGTPREYAALRMDFVDWVGGQEATELLTRFICTSPGADLASSTAAPAVVQRYRPTVN